jgi:hypothetical protein
MRVMQGGCEGDSIVLGALAPAAARVAFVSQSMQRQLTAFVERPCQATFMAVRSAVLSQSPLPMAAAEIAELEQLLSQEEYQAVLDRIDALPASKILSPRVHYLAAEAAEAVGDSASVELERSLFVLALRGLLSTGDGTSFNPYVVCHASDEYDILATLGREPAGQSLAEREGRLLDVIVCADGRETCFDVTDVLVRPARRKRSVKPRVPTRRRRASRVSR